MPRALPSAPSRHRLALLALTVLAVPALASCTENGAGGAGDPGGPGGDERTVSVASTADACEMSAVEAPAGTLRFDVTNEGSEVTEFYLLAEDGLRIVAEVENVGPQLSRQLVVDAPAGEYVTACKPGMVGEGIRSSFTVTPSDEEVEVPADEQELVDRAEAGYQTYVQDQSDQLLVKTRQFAEAYTTGDDDAARELYPRARTHWERIETVAESFGDLDPRMDAREADLEPGQRWTGWHRMEKDLWPERAGDYTPLSDARRQTFADALVADTEELDGRIGDLEFSVDQIANGSRGLLEEVATGKVTGEEEYWSRTDLWDFQANVDGARVGYDGVEPIVTSKDAELASQLELRFADLQELLDAQRVGDGFTSYDDLTRREVRDLADAVNALSEPLSRLTATVLA